MAALPAWTLGQADKAKTEPAKPAAKSAELEIVLDGLIFELLGDTKKQADGKVVGADDNQIKEIEARIAQLKVQLELLKQRKAATNPLKKAEPLQFRLKGNTVDGTAQLWIIDNEPKKPETKTKELKPPASIELKVAPGGTITHGVWRTEPAPGAVHSKRESDAKQPAYKVIGPDGKELKGVTVIDAGTGKVVMPAQTEAPAIIQHRRLYAEALKSLSTTVEMKRATIAVAQPAASGNTVSLSRATYHLSKARAEALAAFLQANVKASVLELKVENNGLTVTTTPDLQATIGGIVKVMTTDGDSAKKAVYYLEMMQEQKPKQTDPQALG